MFTTTTKLSFPGHLPAGLGLPRRRRTTPPHSFNPNSGNGNIVDENMIILRKRIHEMKMAERNYEPPEEWMEWEKKYYTSYESDVCEVVGVLQFMLMNTRPSLAIGMMLMLLLSLPTSCILILLSLFDASKWIL
ncbi:hypothetical protein J5N97_027878 [Dioscorea zingiberensis]|uniref:Uncharacterized protein n=1 Tax=Dioscorea zingiberensis TaxID=325984 RepID=A0A9D5BY47_9LILI|nr:hypothetical protein J5N97_027878 [Dioscorea zingiberensis]